MHHGGRRIFGVGAFRDAVRSTKKRVAYACLAGSLPANMRIVSRLRKDAALYAVAPPRQEGPQARSEKAVRRQAPFAWWTMSLVMVW